MSETKLILHCGAREVEREALRAVPTPDPTDRWFPIGHDAVITTVEHSLTAVGITINKARYGLSRGDMRMFATLDLAIDLIPGVTLAAGIRNSLDKSFPLGFCAGHRVFCCDNLAFSAELLVKRKHTRFGHDRFKVDVTDCVGRLQAFRDAEVARIVRMQKLEITDRDAESLMLRAYEHEYVSHRHLPKLIGAWRDPRFDGSGVSERTAWALFNCFSLVMSDLTVTNPQRYAAATMKLQALLSS
jgi:hypothetical protein